MTITASLYAPAAGDATAAPPRTLRVVIAEDHALYRHGVARAIERDPTLELVGEATDGVEALALLQALEPDVAVLDLRMPGLDGLEVCRRLREDEPASRTRVLALSAFDDDEVVWQGVESGVAGFVGKDASLPAICAAIRDVGEGHIAFTERTSRAVGRGFDRLFGHEARDF